LKVIAAKLNAEPSHSLSISDVKYILSIVPEKWLSGVGKVVLSNTLFKNSRFDRPVFGSAELGAHKINILSRGFKKEDIAMELLRELAVIGGVGQTPSINHLPNRELKKVDQAIAQYLKDFLNART